MAAPAWLTARPIAHRGLHAAGEGVIENSLTAAEAAIAGGFAIECDVQLSADGEIFVFHDFTLDRLTGESGRVDGRKAADLAAIALRRSDDRLPTLTHFLDHVAGRVPVVVEIKSRFDGDLRATERTLAVIAGRGDEPIAVKSFDPAIVAALRRLAPALPRGIVGMNDYSHGEFAPLGAQAHHALANLLHYGETRPDFISWKVADLVSAAPYLCRTGIGLPLMTWTVRSAEDRATASAHADQIVFEGFRP
jgi:glycerophosphoryl diester phosphodiesterase